MNARVVEGPVTIGNVFGYFGSEVPEGRFAVVSDGEYCNGGRGPSQVGPQRLFTSRADAEAAAAYTDAGPA